MATVHVLVGQCGNQLGCSFLDAIADAAESASSEEYQRLVSSTHFRAAFRQQRLGGCRSPGSNETNQPANELPQPRCVMVDMEPKVIQQCIARTNQRPHSDSGGDASGTDSLRAAPKYCLAPQQCVMRGEGSGNNWAFGYYHQGQSRREDIAECLRRESELCGSTVSTYHVLHSVAGGTGSGVGCVVAEVIKDMYPRATLLHSLVWPFTCGEVATQWYNIVLALATLSDTVDGAFVAFNDDISNAMHSELHNRGLSSKRGSTTYAQLNQRISELIAPLYLPQLLYRVPSPLRDVSKRRMPGVVTAQEETALAPLRFARSEDVVEAVALDPAMKFFTGISLPTEALGTGPTTWPGELSDAARTSVSQFVCDSAFAGSRGPADAVSYDAGPQSISSSPRSCLWVVRGPDAQGEALRELRHLMALQRGSSAFPLSGLLVGPASHSAVSASATWDGSYGERCNREVTLYGPTASVGVAMARALTRVEELLAAGAYVHHFDRFGVGVDDIRDAVARGWDAASAYGI